MAHLSPRSSPPPRVRARRWPRRARAAAIAVGGSSSYTSQGSRGYTDLQSADAAQHYAAEPATGSARRAMAATIPSWTGLAGGFSAAGSAACSSRIGAWAMAAACGGVIGPVFMAHHRSGSAGWASAPGRPFLAAGLALADDAPRRPWRAPCRWRARAAPRRALAVTGADYQAFERSSRSVQAAWSSARPRRLRRS